MSLVDYFSFYSFSSVKVETKEGRECEGFVMRDMNGNIVDQKKVMNIIKKLHNYYFENNIDNLNDLIVDTNKRNELSRYSFPYDSVSSSYMLMKPTVEKRYVRDNIKSHWGFSCNWCGEKWSSKLKDHYFITKFDIGYGTRTSEMACTESCATHIHIDLQKSWIHDNGFSKYFII